jgi:hypothetical protein
MALILTSPLLLILVATALTLLRTLQPKFRYPWVVAAGGSILAFLGTFLWRPYLPLAIPLFSWGPTAIFQFRASLLVDQTSWVYALSLTGLAVAVILTSVVRAESEPGSWAGALFLAALGILAVCAANPFTLILGWTVIDFAELIFMLRSTEGESQSQSVVVAFAIRVLSTGLIIWALVLNAAGGLPPEFQLVQPQVGLILLLAAGLRLGVLPLNLPYRKENVMRRGLGTLLRLVSAASSLALLARIPAQSLNAFLPVFLLILAILAALYAGWMWLSSSDEIVGRPFLVLGLAALSVACSLRADPAGSIGWGAALILCGGFIFLYSARERSILWLPMTALWGLSALPFSLTSSAWLSGNASSIGFVLPLLPAQALLIAGFIRHALHPGETSLESQPRWVRLIYPAGLLLLPVTALLLGLWGWNGSRILGLWWTALPVIGLVLLLLFFESWISKHAAFPSAGQWIRTLHLDSVPHVFSSMFTTMERATDLLSGTLEGEGGIFWSFVLLVLILTLLV